MVIASFIIGLMVSVTLLSIEIGTQFFRNWKRSLTELEHYRSESLQAQLQNLKNQINPHFLFNNLSVLSSLVHKDQEKAVSFIDQLAKVYRYSLDSGSHELITLEQEIIFIRSYIYLLQIRFDNGISINLSHNPVHERRLIPPMALQMLIENAIKHNETSDAHPLHISVNTDDEYLTVTNNRKTKSQADSRSGTGLHNIRERYRHFTGKQVEIISSDSEFTVRLPLLRSL